MKPRTFLLCLLALALIVSSCQNKTQTSNEHRETHSDSAASSDKNAVMDSSHSGHNMAGMDHQKTGAGDSVSLMEGMDHSTKNHERTQAGQEKPDNHKMTTMEHRNMSPRKGNNGMDHSMMNMKRNQDARGKSLDHADMNPSSMRKEKSPNSPKMNMDEHANMKQDMPNTGRDTMPGMRKMLHGAMDEQSHVPLIDPTPPYDNNPAWEQKMMKQRMIKYKTN
jgi:hypothetical protein